MCKYGINDRSDSFGFTSSDSRTDKLDICSRIDISSNISETMLCNLFGYDHVAQMYYYFSYLQNTQTWKDSGRIRIGKRIAQLREQAGMSQAELAEKINTKQHAISRIEKGAFNVGFDTLQSIAEIFGMNIDFTK